MRNADVSEISATSEISFDDAVKRGIAFATRTRRDIQSAWVQEQTLTQRDGRIDKFCVSMTVTYAPPRAANV